MQIFWQLVFHVKQYCEKCKTGFYKLCQINANLDTCFCALLAVIVDMSIVDTICDAIGIHGRGGRILTSAVVVVLLTFAFSLIGISLG